MEKEKHPIMEIVDDYGAHYFTVSSIVGEIYNFYQKDAEGNRLRYNANEGRVEVYKPEHGYWDVYIGCVYGASLIKGDGWTRDLVLYAAL